VTPIDVNVALDDFSEAVAGTAERGDDMPEVRDCRWRARS
jgi:hypothetical protein